MMGKNRLSYDPSKLSATERHRANVLDLFSNNLLSGKRCQSLIDDAFGAGNANFRNVSSSSARQHKKPRKTGQEARDLRQRVLRSSQWPGVYWCEVRVVHKRTKAATTQWVAIWLPHELIACIGEFSDLDKFLQSGDLDPSSQLHLEKCEAAAGEKFLALGLWGDGIPVNWDRSESIETIAISFPGLTSHRNLRIPLVGLSKKQCCDETWVDIFNVIQWSFQHCATGSWPTKRHDDKPWFKKSDRARSKVVGKPLGLKAVLVEMRGDWEFFARVFGFPRWNTKNGCCWRCNTTPAQVPISFPNLMVLG